MLDTVLLLAVLVIFATGVVVDGLLQLLAASVKPARAALARSAATATAPTYRRPAEAPLLLRR